MKKKRGVKNTAKVVDRYPWWRFINDQRTWVAIDALLDRDLCEEDVVPMLQRICALPALWAELSHETLKERQTRRAKLAKQIRQIALAIEQDPEARHFRVWGADATTTTPIDGKPTIANYLRDFSQLYEKRGNGNRDEADWLAGETTTHMEFSKFVRREIALLLMFFLKDHKETPNAAAMNLANALIGGNSVTKEQIKQTFRHIKTKGV